jgi:hypothetical protein
MVFAIAPGLNDTYKVGLDPLLDGVEAFALLDLQQKWVPEGRVRLLLESIL